MRHRLAHTDPTTVAQLLLSSDSVGISDMVRNTIDHQ